MKINKKQHITKQGIVKKNPVNKSDIDLRLLPTNLEVWWEPHDDEGKIYKTKATKKEASFEGQLFGVDDNYDIFVDVVYDGKETITFSNESKHSYSELIIKAKTMKSLLTQVGGQIILTEDEDY